MKSRTSGVLLHISSLPSAGGIGDLGPAAFEFARLLAAAGQSWWQILPLTPTSPSLGNSPYSSFSAFAGNPLFISPELLARQGLVSYADLDAARAAAGGGDEAAERVDFARVEAERQHLLRTAFERNRHILATDAGFLRFLAQHRHWLEEYALFVTLKAAFDGRSWVEWPEPLRLRDPHALAGWMEKESIALQREYFIQYLFHAQWGELRRACKRLGLRLVGDVPIYVTHDSADVWANPQYFKLDAAGNPTAVAGVPPDYFSETGQRWGNPVYQWDALEADGFRWWTRRLEHNLWLCDWVRLDHFRGFAGYWEIPVEEETAVNGAWVAAPGKQMFAALTAHLPSPLPVIAEDLGVITDDVRELQQAFALPGMKVLQFGFDGQAHNEHLPHNLTSTSSVLYTGTHDNDTSVGWYAKASEETRDHHRRYMNVSGNDPSWELIRLAYSSVAETVIVPIWDVMRLDGDNRMNTPGVASGNWQFRYTKDMLQADLAGGLNYLAQMYARKNG